MRERTPYQKEMDQVHLSEEKANETLRMMLAENTRLRAKETTRAPKPWLKPALVSVAAVALALVLVFSGGRNETYTWQSIRTDVLPVGGVSRGDDASVPFSEAFGKSAADFFSGTEVFAEEARTWTTPAGARHQGSVTLEMGSALLFASVTDFEPAVTTLIEKEQKIGGVPVRLAREENILYAVYRQDGFYVVLSTGELDEDAMLKALKAVLPS